MSEPFFITGLPRSRTAWFACAASTASTICYHEPSAWASWEQIADMWRWPVKSVGVSDSGLSLGLNRVLAEIKPRTLIIERDPEEVHASLKHYLGKLYNCSLEIQIAERLDKMGEALKVEHPLIKRVEFDALRSQPVLRDCFDWLGVEPINLPQLMNMNIQSSLDWNIALLRAA